MGVKPVDGYGEITQANAADIYRDIQTYRSLDEAQKRLVDRYVPNEEKDKIDYEMQTTNARENGRDKIDDAEKADEHGGQGGNAAATSVGMAVGAVGLMEVAKKGSILGLVSGFKALASGAIALACAILAVASAKLFDNGYNDRVDASGNADNTNSTINQQTEGLLASMDMMDEDYAAYQEETAVLTEQVNGNNSDLADLQVQLADAKAAGDKAGVESISAQIKAAQGADFSEQEEALQEKRDGLEEYRAMSAESEGVAGAGSSVSEFLKEGTPLGVVASIDAAILAIAATFCTIASGSSLIGSSKDFACFNFAGGAAGIAGSAMFMAATVLAGTSTAIMANKAKKEFECGSAGRDMEGHVNALNDMIEQQGAYTDETQGAYEETDAAALENTSEGVEMANNSSTSNDGKTIHTKPDDPIVHAPAPAPKPAAA